MIFGIEVNKMTTIKWQLTQGNVKIIYMLEKYLRNVMQILKNRSTFSGVCMKYWPFLINKCIHSLCCVDISNSPDVVVIWHLLKLIDMIISEKEPASVLLMSFIDESRNCYWRLCPSKLSNVLVMGVRKIYFIGGKTWKIF